MGTYTDYSPEAEAVWNRIRSAGQSVYPFSLFAWQQRYAAAFPSEGTPLILVHDTLPAAASFLINGTTAVLGGGGEISDYQDAIGNGTAFPSFWDEAVSALRDRGGTALMLRNIPEGSPTLGYFRSRNATIRQEDTTPVMSLPASWDLYRSSLPKKYRHELERKLRKFDREHAGASFGLTDAAEGMERLLTLMGRDADKRRFLTPAMRDFFTGIPSIASDSVRFHVLRFGETAVAAVAGFAIGGEYLLYNSGFDETAVPGAGFYLKASVIRWAVGNGFSRFNFLQGNERYKYELGGTDFPVYSVSAAIA